MNMFECFSAEGCWGIYTYTVSWLQALTPYHQKTNSSSAPGLSPERVYRGAVDISSIPRNAIIKEALLDLSQYTVKGDPSYMRSMWGNMGALEVYYMQYGTYDNLGINAYTDAGKLVANGKLTSPPDYPWDVKESGYGVHILQSLVNNGEPRCQLRLQFFTSTNWDSTSDMLCFDNATLTIRYSTP